MPATLHKNGKTYTLKKYNQVTGTEEIPDGKGYPRDLRDL